MHESSEEVKIELLFWLIKYEVQALVTQMHLLFFCFTPVSSESPLLCNSSTD